jgi:hypothetical protein
MPVWLHNRGNVVSAVDHVILNEVKDPRYLGYNSALPTLLTQE